MQTGVSDHVWTGKEVVNLVGRATFFMDNQELLLEGLRKSIKDSKRLKLELEQTVATRSKLIETVEGAKDAAEKLKDDPIHI